MTQKLVLDSSIEEFCRVVATDSQSTSVQYAHRLHDFGKFLLKQYDIGIDSFIVSPQFDVYKVLADYHAHLKSDGLQKNTIATRIRTAKIFLEYNDIAISSTKFRLKVRAPKQKYVELKALPKDTVRKIILACQNTRLQTYVLTLSATGMRANEALSIRYKDIDWPNSRVTIRAEYTKTKVERTVLLTSECAAQLKLWKEYRERKRRIINRAHEVHYVTKPFEPNDLFFTSGRHDDVTDPAYIYHTLSQDFSKVLDRIGLSERHENLGNRHRITLHSFRRFVKSTISGLGYQDFSEYFIGHSGSTYWRKSESEILELFKKIEPYLTFLQYDKLEAQGADIETKLSEKDHEMQAIKQQMNTLVKAFVDFTKTGIVNVDMLSRISGEAPNKLVEDMKALARNDLLESEEKDKAE